jgi:drug/metabolite transporter (DMT)-like permease
LFQHFSCSNQGKLFLWFLVTQPRFPKLAIAALLAIALLWGYNWTQMKIAVQYAPPFTFAALRTICGGLSLLVAMIVLRQPLRPKEIPLTFSLGVLQTAGVYGLASWALVSGGAGKTSLVYTMPFWTVLLAWRFLGERIQGLQWGAIAIAFTGLLIILDPLNLKGTILSSALAILAGLSWAGGSIVAKKLQQKTKVDLLSLTTWQTLFGAIPLLIVMLLLPASAIEWSPAFIGALVYNIVPATAIPSVLWLYVLSRLSAGMSGLGMLLTPVLGVVFASLQLNEQPQVSELVGMALIIGALVLLSVNRLRVTNS